MTRCARRTSWPPPDAAARRGCSKVAHEHSIETTNNEVDIGVRVEVPNSVMDHLTEHLYEAKLVYYSDTFENKVRTFCMNPGGLVSEEHYDGGIAVVNGHSYNDQKLRTRQHQLRHAGIHALHPAVQPAHRVRPLHRPAGQHAHRRRRDGAAPGRSAEGPPHRRFPPEEVHHHTHADHRRARATCRSCCRTGT